jgi:hypothetical protein
MSEIASSEEREKLQSSLKILKSFGRYEEEEDYDIFTGESLRPDYQYREPETNEEKQTLQESINFICDYQRKYPEKISGYFIYHLD